MTDLLNVLAEMQQGQVLADCNLKFNELLTAIRDTSKKGEMTIKLKVVPSKFAMGGGVLQMELEHEATIKKPELSVGSSMFFVGNEGDLTREHPDQIHMVYDAEREEKERKG